MGDSEKKIGDMIKSDVAVLENELPFLKHSPESPKDQDLSDEKALTDAYYDLHLAERKLTDAESRMNLISAEERKLSKSILTTIRKLQNSKFDEERVGDKLDIFEKLEILSQGIKAVSGLKEEWDNLVRYFQDFKLRIDFLLGVPLDNFLEMAENDNKNSKYKDTAIRVSKEQLYQLAYSTSITAYNIHHKASAYIQISETYFMPAVSGLNTLIQLDHQANIMLEKINEILLDQEKEFDYAVNKRIRDLKKQFSIKVLDRLPAGLKSKAQHIETETKEKIDTAIDEFSSTIDDFLYI